MPSSGSQKHFEEITFCDFFEKQISNKKGICVRHFGAPSRVTPGFLQSGASSGVLYR